MTHPSAECPSSRHEATKREEYWMSKYEASKHHLLTLKKIVLGLLLLGALACQQSKENAFAGKSGVAVEYYSNSTNVRARYETKEGVKNGLF